jgi:exosortase A-associated hydrolase 1
MRFDYRGMGDSEGYAQTFETVNEDIRAAINAFLERVPSVRRVAIWGLCDAASSALLYAHTDARVSLLILLNPWVHTEAGAARAQLKYYYLARLTQRSFWSKLLTGKVKMSQSVGDLKQSAQSVVNSNEKPSDPRHGSPGYIARMLHGLQAFQGETLLILSGNDLVAQEFIALTQNDKHWKKTCASARITRWTLKAANHTFSSQTWRDEVGKRTIEWIF